MMKPVLLNALQAAAENPDEPNHKKEQYKELNDLSILSLNISEFIYYNLKAVSSN